MSWKMTYDDIHCLIQVYHYTLLIDNGNRRDGTFREHVNDIEYRSVGACSGDWVIGILAFRDLMGRGGDICANLESSER